MRVSATLLAVAVLFLVTGCKDEPVEQGEAGISTHAARIAPHYVGECCCEPPPEEEWLENMDEAPDETYDSELTPIASTDDGSSESEI